MIPTSNHNYFSSKYILRLLYIFWFLHQTTTVVLLLILLSRCISFDSYIKPQLLYDGYGIILSCISFDSYIKPQLSDGCPSDTPVVYLLIPTSNHNWINSYKNIHEVVYLLIPTSNHNYILGIVILRGLYIFWFLHQTTTWAMIHWTSLCCISFDSYIKPQLFCFHTLLLFVVYLLIPTSNHNSVLSSLCTPSVVYLLIPTSNHN